MIAGASAHDRLPVVASFCCPIAAYSYADIAAMKILRRHNSNVNVRQSVGYFQHDGWIEEYRGVQRTRDRLLC